MYSRCCQLFEPLSVRWMFAASCICGLKVKLFGKTSQEKWAFEVKLLERITTEYADAAPAERRQTDPSCDRNSVLSGASIWLGLSASLTLFPPCRKTITDLFLCPCGRFLISFAQSICPSVRGPLSSVQIYSFFHWLFAHPIPVFPDKSQASQEQGAGVPEQFTGLLHGSSPVFDCSDDIFRLPGVQVSSQKNTGPQTLGQVKEEVTTVPPAPSRPNMAAILTNCDPNAIYATVHKEPKDSGSGAAPAVRSRPPGDLKLARSLSKSDSDLLVSPPNEEEGVLGNRSESVSNCSTGKKRLEKSPSFTSEWDEVSFSPLSGSLSVLSVTWVFCSDRKYTCRRLVSVVFSKHNGWQPWAASMVSPSFICYFQATLLLLSVSIKTYCIASAIFHLHGTAWGHENWFQGSIYEAGQTDSQARVSLLMPALQWVRSCCCLMFLIWPQTVTTSPANGGSEVSIPPTSAAGLCADAQIFSLLYLSLTSSALLGSHITAFSIAASC